MLALSTESFAVANYGCALDQIPEALKQLDAHKVTVLDAHTIILAMKGNFTDEIEKAQRMIKYAPMSARGYLHVGEILVMVKKHVQAISVDEDGLNTLTTNHNMNYLNNKVNITTTVN